MKPIVIYCGDPEGVSLLPAWLEGQKLPKHRSPEDFLKSDLRAIGAGAVLLCLGPKVLSAVRALRRHPETALLPIAAHGGTQIPSVDAELLREEEVREKAERIRAALDSFEPVEAPQDLADLSLLLFLRFLASRGLSGLDAQRDIASPYGYSYPLCGIFFNDSLETWPNDLVRLNFFTRRFHDLLHVCSHCDRYNLNFREICVSCGSSNIGLGEVLHHFRCGEISPEPSFRRDDELFCPKCNQLLRHLGVDYDRPSEFYACRVCPAVFSDPLNDAFCLSCGQKSKLNELREHIVYSYFLTEEGRRTAREGLFPSGAMQALFDRELGGLYSAEFFQEFTKIEFRRRKRYGGNLAILALQIDFPQRKTLSIKKLHQIVWNLSRILRENLRDSDLLARFSERTYLSLLTDTPKENAPIVAARLEKAVNQALIEPGGRFLVRDATEAYRSLLEKGPIDAEELERSLSLSSREGEGS